MPEAPRSLEETQAQTQANAETSVDGQGARVVFQPNGRQGDVATGTTLLEAARRMGVEIESICGGHQTCGKCKVHVEEGEFAKLGIRSTATNLTPPGEREISYAEKHSFGEGMRMSCACEISGDLVITVPEESQTRKQVVRKDAGMTREISVDAPMRLYYVELPEGDLKDHRGDWERLQDELQDVHGLKDLRVDLSVLIELQDALARARRAITVTVLSEQEVVRVQPGFHEDIYGIAFDVGTTTVAGHLCHLRTGELLASASRMNPQVPYGEDLMSRVSYAMMHDDGTERMHTVMIEGINGLIADMCEQAGITTDDVVEVVAVGNTTMHHILLNINPRELGGSPFSLVTHSALDIKARDLGVNICRGGNFHVPPCEAGHVGADNVGVLVAEAPYHQDKQQLIIDIGTNGEILLGNRDEVMSASSPTGPAFEGAQILHGMRAADGAIERIRIDPVTLEVKYRIIGKDEWLESEAGGREREADGADIVDDADLGSSPLDAREARKAAREALLNPELKASGICGSGIIEGVAELFLAGVISPNGRFVALDHPRLRTGLGNGGGKAEFVLAWPHETSTGREIVIHSDDIRAIQLAKAALYAGAKLLMRRMGLESVDHVVLAGGFGSYIDPIHAMVLGLIPDCDLSLVTAVGNAAGDGARMILLDREKRAEAQWAARWVTYVETAVEPSFQEDFVVALDFPHATDPFPKLSVLIEEARAKWPPERHESYAAFLPNRGDHRTSRSERESRRSARAARRKQ
jgi:uncharacterized 2Fe-2S/4Fe-4S cluster protein (DUF4445 family)